nr:hypothetical protein [Xenorhabdus mauleonii]
MIKPERPPRSSGFLSSFCLVIANQLPHPQLNVTDLRALALVLLFEAVRLVTVGDQHQAAIHDFYGNRAANLKARLFKPLPLKVNCGTYPRV